MKSLSRIAALAGILGVVGGLMAEPAAAQEWPSRPVTLVVPFGPGASNDLFTRALADFYARKFKQPFVVENRPGAGGWVGVNHVIQSPADGYTLFEMASGISIMGRVQKVNFDARKDITSIAMIARSPTALVVPGSLPVKSVQELIDYAKKNPDTTFYGTTGLGTTQHLNAELFNLLAGTKMKPVVYKSSGEAQTDLVAGRVQAQFVTVASTLGQIQNGQLRLLAYTSDGITSTSPKAPTIDEAGVKGYKAAVWWGLFGPPGLPADITRKMNEATIEAMSDPKFKELLEKSGATPTPIPSAQFAKELADETAQLEDVMKAANIVFP